MSLGVLGIRLGPHFALEVCFPARRLPIISHSAAIIWWADRRGRSPNDLEGLQVRALERNRGFCRERRRHTLARPRTHCDRSRRRVSGPCEQRLAVREQASPTHRDTHRRA